ncbi:MAG: timeless protein-domain-containing protein [Benjaminiella poitrasii]|nr:MAG: timeless protein-domain-containing protein [Benjaminiella poitrasii]
MDEDLAEIEQTKAYILNLCSAIGGLEEVKQADGSIAQIYCVGDEALACLRDLKRAIRLDSENNEKIVLNALVEYNVIETDIVPLILSFRHQRNDVAHRFILACVELLVPMTWPLEKKKTIVQEDEEEEENPNVMQCYRKYKLDLLTEGVFETILTMIMKSVRIPHRDRSLVDHTTIRLALYLFRNLAAIPDLNTALSGATAEQIRMAHMQEKLMMRYYEADVIEFLLTIASNSEKQEGTSEWNVLVLESLFHLLKHVDARDVFLYQDTEDRSELHEISSKLSSLLTAESKMKRQKTSHVPSRHNRFGGTYVLDWDGKRRISHRQEAGFADATTLIENEKKINRVGIKRKLEENITKRKVYEDRKALMYLKLTAQSFIVSCFNAFYDSLLKDMKREDSKIVEQDYARYHFTMRWFLEYFHYEQRKRRRAQQDQLILPSANTTNTYFSDQEFDFALVASAINLSTVLFCLRQMRIKLEEKAWLDVQVAADCLRYMLVVIGSMASLEKTEANEDYHEIAEHIQQNLFYEQTSFDLFVSVVKSYKAQSYGYLKAVVMLTHVLLKLLDHYQKNKKMMFIRKRTKKKAKKKAPVINDNNEDEEDLEDDEEEEESLRQNEREYKDTVFQFAAFEEKYIHWDIVTAYCTLLECYQDLEPEYFTCITTMFHRMMVKRKAEYLFWKLPVLELFNRVLIDFKKIPGGQKSREMAQLEEFIRYAVYQFFKSAKEYPLLFVEALVPSIKSNRLMWETPSPPTEEEVKEREEEERYLADVNYIPPADEEQEDNQANSKDTEREEEEEVDEEMMDYYFSEFDKKKAQEKVENGTKINDESQSENNK